MGGRRLRPQTIRRGPGSQQRGQAATPGTKQAKGGGHPAGATNTVQRLKDLQALVGNNGVAKLLEKKPDAETNPSVREALMKLSLETFERVIDRVPGLFGPAALLMSTPMAPGPNMNQVGIAQMSASLIPLLAELDGAIHQYEKAGGELTDIQPIVALRAQLSTALFYLNQLQGGTGTASQLLQSIQEAINEGTKYRLELAIRKANQAGGHTQEGPRTKQTQMAIDAKVLQWRSLFLSQPGLYPSPKGWK